MAKMRPYKIGGFCWNEVATRDLDGAKKFYAELFGWTTHDTPMGDIGIYTTFKLGGKDVMGLYEMKGEQFGDIPPHWMAYIAVEDCDASMEKLQALGGSVKMPTLDVPNVGRMAVVADPQGAVFSLFQRESDPGEGIPMGPGTVCWNELATSDAEGATKFYAELIKWGASVQDMGPMKYTTWMNGESMAAGMMQMTEEWGGVPPHWMSYVEVADCDGSVKKAQELGGKLLHGPQDIPSVGRFAVIQDPQGAVFSIIKMAQQS